MFNTVTTRHSSVSVIRIVSITKFDSFDCSFACFRSHCKHTKCCVYTTRVRRGNHFKWIQLFLFQYEIYLSFERTLDLKLLEKKKKKKSIQILVFSSTVFISFYSTFNFNWINQLQSLNYNSIICTFSLYESESLSMIHVKAV